MISLNAKHANATGINLGAREEEMKKIMENRMSRLTLTSVAATLAMTGAAYAETEITLWHAMGGALGETVNQIAEDFNASQDEVVLTPVFKGTYEETLTL